MKDAYIKFFFHSVCYALDKLEYEDIFLKVKQYQVLVSLLEKRDTVAILPTGYGKSIIFHLFPFVAPLRKFPIGIPIGKIPIRISDKIPIGIPIGKIPIGIPIGKIPRQNSYRNSYRKNSYRNSYRKNSYRNSYRNLIFPIGIPIEI